MDWLLGMTCLRAVGQMAPERLAQALHDTLIGSESLLEIREVSLRTRTLAAPSVGSNWQTTSSPRQDEHEGRCPSHLVWRRHQPNVCKWLHVTGGRSAYLDLRRRHALHARAMRQRLLFDAAVSGACSESAVVMVLLRNDVCEMDGEQSPDIPLYVGCTGQGGDLRHAWVEWGWRRIRGKRGRPSPRNLTGLATTLSLPFV